jgi:hypothetical protein
MTRHEFIFSDQRRHRIIRHVIFWVAWWLAYTLLFHVPVLELKGWGLSREAAPSTFRDVQLIGPILYSLKILIFHSLLAIVLPQAILTYFLLYWYFPIFFYKKKNPFVTVAVLVVILLVYRFFAVPFLWFTGLGNYVFRLPYNMPTFNAMTSVGGWSSLRQQLGSLPVLLGVAVMITLIKRWWLKQQETEQVAREKTKAELQLLKGQVHPHFLFNTLNNIYFFTLSGSPKAPDMITKLSGLLHYILDECNQTVVPLEKEMKMIRDYVSLEKIRYGDDMNMSVELPDNCPDKMIAPLLLIPFIENSFKHGTSRMLTHPYVRVSITIENNIAHFFVSNSRPQVQDSGTTRGNIGLNNVKKRLQLLYPFDHELNIVEEPGSFTVFLRIKLMDRTVPNNPDEEIKSVEEYAVA